MAHKAVKKTAVLIISKRHISLRLFCGKWIKLRYKKDKADRKIRPTRWDDRRLAAHITDPFDDRMADDFLLFQDTWFGVHREIVRKPTKRGAK